MAGNQRQEQKAREKKHGTGKVSKISLADALGATHQNTVPVLPAFGPANQRDSSQVGASPTVPGNWEELETSRQPAGGPGTAPAPPAPYAPAQSQQAMIEAETTRSLAKSELVLPDVIADSIPLEKKATVAKLGESRALAVPEQEVETPAIFIRGARKPPRYNYARVVPRRSGPRPIAVQFIVSMLSVMLLFTVFTAVSPLGKSLASLGFVEAYANSVPWVPTATPRPTATPIPVYDPPTGSGAGTQIVVNDIVAIFGGYSTGALNVARCESGYNPNAYNPYAIGNSHAEGVFQILYPSTWYTTSFANSSPYDAVTNIRAAYQIFSRDGYTWQEWACQP